ncbi:group II intron reverse transcriptase/maturase [Clostridium rectalis]|uniref:group II intron reverse transcriptase/maturase n=1 Tax=Clostridium rectalis TaxID=2040295 RepID=UPI001FA9A37F|nr:group II intron reverse transcriptase/maturase [Clostridium rectalis]
MKESLLKKKQKLRNNEYYNMQDLFDNLHSKARRNYKFTDLMKYIASENNILLAYRNIKRNDGSVTVGTDGLNVNYFEKMDSDYFVKLIQRKLQNYHPKSVRRVEIPKNDGTGRTRPLGIPCIEDRIIQQCIKQVLEPICEAKFHKHSYGFRPNRSTNHAIARCNYLMWKSNLHYVVDIDIKSFFDNVNHAKLKKQIWNMGIQDKNLISIIGKTLKSEIEGEGIPTKGTPQGGIISPLLSNIVLNELDWWISSQWETYKTKYKFNKDCNRYTSIKKSNLKEIWIVRYADDFKIFCRNYGVAQKIYNATRLWLKERLDLDISTEKSRITNLRKNYTEFLGIKLKVVTKNNRYICNSRMSDKSKKRTIKKLKEQTKKIKNKTTPQEVNKLNAIILGSHNYYKMATQVNLDFSEINFLVTRTLYNRLKNVMKKEHKTSKAYQKLYGEYNGKKYTISETTIFPIYGVKTKSPMNFTQVINNYTIEGRKLIHEKLGGNLNKLIEYALTNTSEYNSTEYNDNRVSLIAGQKGKCGITGECLKIGNMECHHKIPKHLGGTDEYKNLIWVCTDVHKLIHATVEDTVNKYLDKLELDDKGLKRLNSLRKLVGNSYIQIAS